MATVVVSGRVDKDIKSRVDVLLRAKGVSPADVISTVWENIARTGELPVSQEQEDEFRRRREAYAYFLKVVSENPTPNPQFAGMSDDEILALRLEDYV